MDTVIQTADPGMRPVVKKSRRRWYILGAAALLLVVTPICFSLIVGWMRDRELEELYAELDADDPNWRWADLIASMPPAPDDQNAFVQMRRVSGMLTKTPFGIAPAWDTDAKWKARDVRNSRLSADNIALLRAAFAPLDPKLLPEARKLKDFPKGRMKIDPAANPMELMLNEVQQTRDVMRLLDSDILLRTHDNDLEGAVESWHALLNTSHAIEDNPALISQLVRMAGQAIAITALERLLGQDELSEPDLAKIQTLLQRETVDNLLYFGLRGERAMNHRIYTDLRDGKTTVSRILGGMGGGPGAGRPGVVERAVDLFPAIVFKGYPEHMRLFSEQVKASTLKEEERMEALNKTDQKVRGSNSIIMRLLMPATLKIGEASQRTQAQLRCAIVAVAAERYRVKHDVWPQGLDELVRERLLDAVPHDPYDGKPLRFRRTPTGIVIYSVSYDKTDNQGKLSTDSRTPDTDFGMQLWDRQFRSAPPPVEQEK